MSISKRRAGKGRRVAYDCLAKREEGEPVFVLLGRDRASAATIKCWATMWLQEISLHLRPESDRAQVTEALRIATDMEIYARDRWQKAQHDTVEWSAQLPDGSRVPATGQHAKRDKNSTSGANDGT